VVIRPTSFAEGLREAEQVAGSMGLGGGLPHFLFLVLLLTLDPPGLERRRKEKEDE